MKRKYLPLFACALAVLTAGCAHAAPPPAYTLIEAEAAAPGVAKADPDASGGQYAARDGAYQPLLTAEIPPAAGDSFVIWARVRGTAIQLKGVAADGKQREFNWVYGKPAEWKWVSFGRHTRAELGAKLLLMQGAGANSDAGLDAVVLAADDTFSPDTLTLPIPPRKPISVTVQWNKTVARATALSYGLNAFSGFNPDVTNNPSYQASLRSMAPGILRLHNWGMMNDSAKDPNGWIDTARRQWDAAKIHKALAGLPVGATLLVNIPAWPQWMDKDKDGFLDTDQTDAYARFCAALVKIVNKDGSRPAAYWEVTNERDGPYYADFHANGGAGGLKDPSKPDRLDELAAIYVKCAAAMKAVDPAIQVGGPAVARPDFTDFVRRFARAAAPHLDFFSYHAYASGSAGDADTAIFDQALFFSDATQSITNILKVESPQRHIGIIFDEYNISWTWETRDPRMNNVKGAVFDALAITSALTHGADATLAWNERDGIYGKMDDAYRLRPGAVLFHLLNAHMVGSIVASTSADPRSIVSYAVRAANGWKSLLLINRASHEQSVILTSWGQGSVTQYCLAPAGSSETMLTPPQFTASLSLPADSVTLLTEK